MAEPFTQSFRSLLPNYFDLPWKPEDGLSQQELDEALTEAGVPLIPTALADFYLAVGAVEEITEAYYYVWDADELEVEDKHLCFMEDEDEKYTWGIRANSLDVVDPLVFRRTNARGTWQSMEATLSEYLLDYFAWVFEELRPALDEADAADEAGQARDADQDAGPRA